MATDIYTLTTLSGREGGLVINYVREVEKGVKQVHIPF
jgi:hypothetical protein